MDSATWKVLRSLAWIPRGEAVGPKHSQVSRCRMGCRWPWAAGNSKYRWAPNLPCLFQSGGALCTSMPFFSSLEACGQEENDATTTLLPRNRQKAGVIHPGDSLQPEISQSQTCPALLWKMGILTFYLENYIDQFSTTSNEERGEKSVYDGGLFPVQRLMFYSNN